VLACYLQTRYSSGSEKGDWVAGLGSKKAHSGDLSRKLVYACVLMKFYHCRIMMADIGLYMKIGCHAFKLYDRTGDEITLDEVEQIAI